MLAAELRLLDCKSEERACLESRSVRVRKREGNTSSVMKLSQLLEKQSSMDEDYKEVLSSLLSLDGKSAPGKPKIERYKDDIREIGGGYALALRHLEDGKLCGQRDKCKKRKRQGNVREQVDDSDIEVVDKSEFEKVCLPQKHRHGNHCVAENICERVYPAQTGDRNKVQSSRKFKKVSGCGTLVKGFPECSKRAEIQFHKEHCLYHRSSRGGAQISERNTVRNRNRLQKANEQVHHQLDSGSCGLENDHKSKILHVRKITREAKEIALVREDKQTDGRINVVHTDKSYLDEKSGTRSLRVKEWSLEHANKAQSGEMKKARGRRCLQQLDRGKIAVGEDGGNDHFHHKHIQEKILPFKHGRAQPFWKWKARRDRKLMRAVKVEVKKEEEKNRVTRSYCQQAAIKTGFGNSAVKEEPDECVETDLHVKGIRRQSRRVEFGGTIPAEVEILDNDMVVKKRILTPFVTNEVYGTMSDEKSQHHGLPSASNIFRKEVLEAISKPYDKEEHQNCRDIMKARSYLNHHPGLREILLKFRYKREKRLIILRGFLFWLQNLTREGAFCPWEDEECLAVEI